MLRQLGKNRRRLLFNSEDYEHMAESYVIQDNSDLDHIYYNVQIFNNTSSYDKNGKPVPRITAVPSNFSEIRLQPFLNRPKDYEASLTYFHLDSNSFPIQIVQPKLGKSYQTTLTSPNGFTVEGFETVFEVKIEFTYHSPPGPFNTTVSITTPVYWKPLDTTLPLPPQPITKNEINNEYFWNYSFDYFLDLVNKSMLYAIDTVTGKIGHKEEYPYFLYDANCQKISLFAPLSFQTDNEGNSNTAPPVPHFRLFINEPLYELLGGLPFIYQNNNTYQLLVQPSPDNSNIITGYQKIDVVPLSKEVNFIKMTQKWITTPLWNPATSIVFTINRVPCVNELLSKPYISGPAPTQVSNNADVLNILFEYYLGRRNDPTINNFTRAEYRLLDLQSVQPVYQLEIETYWRDEFGDLHRFFVETGSGFNMKIMFRKKAF